MSTTGGDPLAVLQRIRKGRPRDAPAPGERCDLCDEAVPDEHGHVVDLEGRQLLCTCRGCYLLFTVDGAGGHHYRAVPDRYVAFPDVHLSAAQWDSLQIPVGVAFFFFNSSLDRIVAFYPGPAGATESLLPLDSWDELVAAVPALDGMEPDVEALLVRGGRAGERMDGGEPELYIVPIDVCYELVGRMRQLWRGFDGGARAHEAIDGIFERVRAKAR